MVFVARVCIARKDPFLTSSPKSWQDSHLQWSLLRSATSRLRFRTEDHPLPRGLLQCVMVVRIREFLGEEEEKKEEERKKERKKKKRENVFDLLKAKGRKTSWKEKERERESVCVCVCIYVMTRIGEFWTENKGGRRKCVDLLRKKGKKSHKEECVF